MFVHVYGHPALQECVVALPDGLDEAEALAEALRRVQSGEAGPGEAAVTQYVAVLPGGQDEAV